MDNNLENNKEKKKGKIFMIRNINEVPADVLFLVYIVSNVISSLLDGFIGDSIGLFSLICLLLAIGKFIQDRLPKK